MTSLDLNIHESSLRNVIKHVFIQQA